jgi:hypothetical protein
MQTLLNAKAIYLALYIEPNGLTETRRPYCSEASRVLGSQASRYEARTYYGLCSLGVDLGKDKCLT